MHNLLNDMQLFVITLFSLIAKSTYVEKTTKACCWTPGIHTDDFRVDHMKYLSRLYKAVEHDKLRSFHTVFHETLMHSYSITYN